MGWRLKPRRDPSERNENKKEESKDGRGIKWGLARGGEGREGKDSQWEGPGGWGGRKEREPREVYG